MSRGFVGTRSSQKKGKSAKEIFMMRAQGRDEKNLSPEERYQKTLQEKIEKIRSKVQKSTRFGVTLPGTEASNDSRELSKSAQEIIEQLAQKRAQKMAKKEKEGKLIISPKYYSGMQGGRIDRNGRIFGPDGVMIATVDHKSGKVKSRLGGTICKYTDNTYCEFIITQYIERQYAKKPGQNSGGGGVWGSGWGDGDDSGGGGGVWGSGW